MRCRQSVSIMAVIALTALVFSVDAKTVRITVEPTRKITAINPLFFGANILFWIDDDAALTNDKFLHGMKELGIRMLRFPGGTAAENYIWKEKRLYNINRFPYRSGPETTDTDEFMRLSRKLNAEPIFVVNTEYSVIEGSVEKGAQLAADWVRYCKDKGYSVKYWSIGNEAYWRPYFTARKYADILIQYEKAMKKIDPSIQVGAIGALVANDRGLADEVSEEGRRILIDLLQNRDQDDDKNQSRKIKNQIARNYRKQGDEWWSTVLALAGNHLDFIDVHAYPGNFEDAFISNKRVVNQVILLRKLIAQSIPGRKIPIVLSEWNLAAGRDSIETKVCCAEQGLYVAEMIGQYINAGIDMATYWPLRMSSGNWRAKALIEPNSSARQPGAFHAFRLFSRYARGTSVVSNSDYDGLFVFAALDNDGTIRLFCVTRPTLNTNSEIDLSIDVPNLVPKSCSGILISAQSRGESELNSTPWEVSCNRKISAKLPAYGVGMIEITP